MAQPPGKNVFKRGQPVDQVELLKNDCHLTQASCHRGCHLAPADANRTSVGSEKTYYATEQRCLAGAARPKNGYEFVPRDGELDILDCGTEPDSRITAAIFSAQLIQTPARSIPQPVQLQLDL